MALSYLDFKQGLSGSGPATVDVPATIASGDFVVTVIDLGPDKRANDLSIGATNYRIPGVLRDNVVMFIWQYEGVNYPLSYDDGAGDTVIDAACVSLVFRPTAPGYTIGYNCIEEMRVTGGISPYFPDDPVALHANSLYVYGIGYMVGGARKNPTQPLDTFGLQYQHVNRVRISDSASFFFTAAIAYETNPGEGTNTRAWNDVVSVTSANDIHTWGFLLTEVEPPPAVVEGGGAGGGPLSIPYKEWAYGFNFEQYRVNMRVIREWASAVNCTGNGPNGQYMIWSVTPGVYTSVAIDAVNSPLDARQHEQNYIDFERWAATTCKPLLLPYKEWMRADPGNPHGPMFEQQILSRIQQWASELGECCTESSGGGEV